MKDLGRLTPQNLGTRAQELLQQACPSKQDEAFFNRHMQRALSQGMTWLEGLQFVILERRALN